MAGWAASMPELLPEPPPRPMPRRRLSWLVAALALGALVLATAGAALVPLPYLAIRPGTVHAVGGMLSVEGAPSHPPASPVAFTTAGIGHLTLLEAAPAWLDGDVDVVAEQQLWGDRDPEENRRFNAALMATSKDVAIAVALRHLGYEVTVRTSGAVVLSVGDGMPAEGLLDPGDVVLAVGGVAVDEPGAIAEALQEGGVGAEHVLLVERGGEEVEVAVRTVASPQDPRRAIIGITTTDRVEAFDHPVEVSIDAGRVGGSSAGLAFALAVIDHLTPGELTGGRQVAVTGTISLDGRVGPVGGTPQKAVTVRDAGYDVFIVPAGQAAAVRARAGGEVEVIGVATLEEALEALSSLGGDAKAPSRPGE